MDSDWEVWSFDNQCIQVIVLGVKRKKELGLLGMQNFLDFFEECERKPLDFEEKEALKCH